MFEQLSGNWPLKKLQGHNHATAANRKGEIPAYFFVFQVTGITAPAAGVLTLFAGWREVVVDAIPYLANRSLDWFLLAMGITLVMFLFAEAVSAVTNATP
ncbi:MAG TPA: hypothetical protein VF450_11270 [Noviherbaspirillum sp.]